MLAQQGSGAEVPATYGTVTRRMVVSDSEIITTTSEQSFNRVAFRVREDISIRDYLESQFSQQAISDCEEGNSFIIWE